METIDTIIRIIVAIYVLFFFGSFVVRFIYATKGNSIEFALKELMSFKYGFPISKSELKEFSDIRIGLAINLLLRVGYVLFMISWIMIIILVVLQNIAVE